MRKIRYGMVGGGRGAFIGAVHRIAAAMDGQYELVCGAFSSEPERSRASGADLYLSPDRCYGDFQEMIAAESTLPEDQRMELVSIVTPNHMHGPVIKAAIAAGFHVICDKPLCLSVDEAIALKKQVDASDRIFALTHNYTGYPMVKQARDLVRDGSIGAVRKVVVEYPQGWLSTRLETTGQKQSGWRTDPKRAGASCCMGDIGSHAENLAEYITGLRITELCADLTTFVAGRELEDDGNVLIRLQNGAKGVLHASQISVGEENGLNIRVYGENGGFRWLQMEPNTLNVLWGDRPAERWRCNQAYTSAAAQYAARIPPGHPEGYLEAFANLYRNVATCIQSRLAGIKAPAEAQDFPTIADGLRGMQFLATVLESAQSDAKWTPFPK